MTTETLEIPVGPLTFDAVAEGPADGPPVLLLHGFPQSAHAWRHVQPALAAAGYRTVAFDQRGYSPRARPAEASAYAIELLVDDALAVADHLGWDAFHVIGHDWGGVVAWHTAGRAANRIRSLTALSTPHPRAFQAARDAGPQADGEDQSAKAGYMDFFREEGSELAFLADDQALFRAGMEGAGMEADAVAHYAARLATAEAMVGPLNWYRGATPADGDKVGPITSPTLYVWSDGDAVFGRLAAETTADQVQGPYRFENLSGANHWFPEQDADRLVPLVLEHLASA